MGLGQGKGREVRGRGRGVEGIDSMAGRLAYTELFSVFFAFGVWDE